MDYKIKYLDKEMLYPLFGRADVDNQIAYVRSDLPINVRKFVLVHELYHLGDKTVSVFWREVKANIAGAVKHPWGFVMCCMMSMAPYRLKLYWDRVKKGY